MSLQSVLPSSAGWWVSLLTTSLLLCCSTPCVMALMPYSKYFTTLLSCTTTWETYFKQNRKAKLEDLNGNENVIITYRSWGFGQASVLYKGSFANRMQNLVLEFYFKCVFLGKHRARCSCLNFFDLLISANILNYNFHRVQISIQMAPRTDPKS